jgi:hypothetical protein
MEIDAQNPLTETDQIVPVLDREFLIERPPVFSAIPSTNSSLISQPKRSPPNTCLIWAMSLRSPRPSSGSSRTGKNLTRRYVAPSLIAAGISGMFSLTVVLLHSHDRSWHAGGYSSSRPEIAPLMWSLCISIALPP